MRYQPEVGNGFPFFTPWKTQSRQPEEIRDRMNLVTYITDVVVGAILGVCDPLSVPI